MMGGKTRRKKLLLPTQNKKSRLFSVKFALKLVSYVTIGWIINEKPPGV
jgi:hypothetical protein